MHRILTFSAVTLPTSRRSSAIAEIAYGLERLLLLLLLRAQSWRNPGTPSLHPAQQALLGILASADDGLRIGKIAECSGVSSASVSDSVTALEAKGLTERNRDPTDARSTRVRLTRRGRGVAHSARGADTAAARLVACLPDRDQAALLRSLQLLIHQAQPQGLATGLRTCLGCRHFRPYASGNPRIPHVCAFLGAPFGDAELRTDCADSQLESPERAAENVARFRVPTSVRAEGG